MTLLAARFATALSYAGALHDEPVREQTAFPNAHLLGTGSIALADWRRITVTFRMDSLRGIPATIDEGRGSVRRPAGRPA